MSSEKTTVLSRVIFPEAANHYETLFGGQTIKQMAEAAFLASTRRERRKWLLAKVSEVRFHQPIPVGAIARFEAATQYSGAKYLIARIDVFREAMLGDEEDVLAASGEFVFVSARS